MIETPFRHVQQSRALRLVVGDTNITTDASQTIGANGANGETVSGSVAMANLASLRG